MLTNLELKEFVSYNEDTGLFTRVKDTGRYAEGTISGSKSKVGYIEVSVNGKRYYAHRLAWFYMKDAWPTEVNHKDHVKDNNKWSNLEEVTHKENMILAGEFGVLERTSEYKEGVRKRILKVGQSTADSIVGKKFGIRTVLSTYLKSPGNRRVICECECGSIDDVSIYPLRKGKRDMCRTCAWKYKVRISKGV